MNWLDTTMTPHGFCLMWDPKLLTWTMLGDGLTALSYFWIPFQLVRAALRQRRGSLLLSPNSSLRGLFAAFILLCGLTHVMHIVTLFVPAYWLEVCLTVVTGGVSFVTAAMMEFVFRDGVSAHDFNDLEQQRNAIAASYCALASGQADPDRVNTRVQEFQRRGWCAGVTDAG